MGPTLLALQRRAVWHPLLLSPRPGRLRQPLPSLLAPCKLRSCPCQPYTDSAMQSGGPALKAAVLLILLQAEAAAARSAGALQAEETPPASPAQQLPDPGRDGLLARIRELEAAATPAAAAAAAEASRAAVPQADEEEADEEKLR